MNIQEEMSMIMSLISSWNSLKEIYLITNGIRHSLDKERVSKRSWRCYNQMLNDINHHRYFGAQLTTLTSVEYTYIYLTY